MTIRLKILTVTSLLLLVFAATTAVSALLISRVVAELEGIADYHIALSDLLANIDVDTFEYELNLRRILANGGLAPEQLEAASMREGQIAERLQQSFERAFTLMAAAIKDERNDVSDSIELARIEGTFRTLQKHIAPFIELGKAVLGDIRDGKWAEARSEAGGFETHESAFGPELAAIRKSVHDLTEVSARETNQQQVGVLIFNAVLFGVAAVVGFALFGVLTQRLARSLRQLLDGTHAVETGQLAIELPVTSKDEIGQLTHSFNRMVGELRAKERIKDTFGKYLDPRIVNDLIGSEGGRSGAAERRTVTVMLSDIAGFTGMAEQLTAAAMVNLLNRYFSVVTAAIRERSGIVDKYIGDAVMAFWTPPFSPGDRHAEDACLSALAQQRAIRDFQRDLSEIIGLRRNVPDFHVRMGLTTGDVVVGTIGSEQAKSYTVIGDSVNVASRLEGVNKIYGTQILMAESTYRLAAGSIEAREIDLLTVAGKTEPVRVYELLTAAGELSTQDEEWRGTYADALAAYRAADWDRAENRFQHCLSLRPEDQPPRVFVRRISHLRENPPPSDWDCVWRLTEK